MATVSITQDLQQPNDPSAWSSISGSQLLQQITGALAYTDKGLVVTTTDSGGVPQVPDAATTTRAQRSLWRRITASACIVYFWNPNIVSDATYLKWVAFTTIPLSQIKYSAVAGVAGITSGSSNQWAYTDAAPNIAKGNLLYSASITAINTGSFFRYKATTTIEVDAPLASNTHIGIAAYKDGLCVGGSLTYIPAAGVQMPLKLDLLSPIALAAGTVYAIQIRANFVKTDTDSTGTGHVGSTFAVNVPSSTYSDVYQVEEVITA